MITVSIFCRIKKNPYSNFPGHKRYQKYFADRDFQNIYQIEFNSFSQTDNGQKNISQLCAATQQMANMMTEIDTKKKDTKPSQRNYDSILNF